MNVRYFHDDWEEDISTDAIPGKYVITIYRRTFESEDAFDDDEIAVIVHRASVVYPLDGFLAQEKVANAALIVDALNKTLQT